MNESMEFGDIRSDDERQITHFENFLSCSHNIFLENLPTNVLLE